MSNKEDRAVIKINDFIWYRIQVDCAAQTPSLSVNTYKASAVLWSGIKGDVRTAFVEPLQDSVRDRLNNEE